MGGGTDRPAVVQLEARVSPAQRDRILALRNSHLQKMESIVRERKDIVWEMQQATVVPETASARQTAFAKVGFITPPLE